MNASMKWLIADAQRQQRASDVDPLDGMTHFRILTRASRRMNATVGSTGYRPNRDP